MTTILDSLPPAVPFTGFPRLRCVYSVEESRLALDQGPVALVTLDGTPFLISLTLADRADGFSVERLYQSGLDALALFAEDRPVLGRAGLDQRFEEGLRKLLDALHAAYRQGQAEEFSADVDRRLGSSDADEAEALVRRIHVLAQSGGLRGYFSYLSADRASLSGLITALWETRTKARQPALAQRLAACGVSTDMLARVDALYGALNQLRVSRSEAAAPQSAFRPLRLLKAMAFGELQALCNTARAALPEPRRERYQIERVLDVSRGGRDATPATPTPTPGPAAPTPVAFATPAAATAPAAVPGATAPWGAAPTAPATPGAALPSGAAAPTAQAGVATHLWPAVPPPPGTWSSAGASAAPTVTFAPPPGTVLSRLEGVGGPAVVAVVQPDGRVHWLPESQFAAPAPSVPQPPTSAPPQPPAAPKRRSRKR